MPDILGFAERSKGIDNAKETDNQPIHLLG